MQLLLDKGARVRVVDNLSSGRLENIQRHAEGGDVEFVEADLTNARAAEAATSGIDAVFHFGSKGISTSA